jgi:hypothetical protein
MPNKRNAWMPPQRSARHPEIGIVIPTHSVPLLNASVIRIIAGMGSGACMGIIAGTFPTLVQANVHLPVQFAVQLMVAVTDVRQEAVPTVINLVLQASV